MKRTACTMFAPPRHQPRPFWRWSVAAAVVLAVLLTGCTELKRRAYEDPERASWQFPGRVIESLALQPGDRVADLGSGSGYFTFRLAEAVGPAGRVYAVDIDEDMNELVEDRAREKGIDHVETILARKHDPRLPESGVDLILAVNSYHHLENRTDYFKNVARSLRPGGRVAIIDFREEAFRHHTQKKVLLREMKEAGYRVARDFDFLPRQNFLIFTPPES